MALTWQSDFSTPATLARDFVIQAKDPSRATLVDCDRTGGKALRLHTEPGDTDIAGSGTMERCDAYRCVPSTADPFVHNKGSSFWFAHSILLPDDYQLPKGEATNLADFHNSIPGPGQANMSIGFGNWNQPEATWGRLQLQRAVGDPLKPTIYVVDLGVPVRNAWYDCLYHVRWSEKADGYFDAWVNGRLVMEHAGPTLYAGQGVYFKAANYRYPTTPNAACSVIHDRVRLGTMRASVE